MGGGSRRGLPRHLESECWEGRAERRAERLQLQRLQRRLERWGGGSPRPGAGAAAGPSARPAARLTGRRWRLWRRERRPWSDGARGARRAEAEPRQESLPSRREAHLALRSQRQPGGLEQLEKRSGSWEELARPESGPPRPGAQSQTRQGAKPRVLWGSQFHTRQFAVPGIPVSCGTQARISGSAELNPLRPGPLPRPSLAEARASGLTDPAARASGLTVPAARPDSELGGARAPPCTEGAAESREEVPRSRQRLCRGRRPSGRERTAEGT